MVQKSLILIIFWLPQAVRQLFIWIYWIQVKEYRYDRFKLLLSSIGGRQNIEANIIVFKILLFVLAILLKESVITILILFILFDLSVLIDLKNESLRKPVFTQRVQRIFITAVILTSLPLVLGIMNRNLGIVHFIYSEVLLILSPFVGVLWTQPIVQKIKSEDVKLAKKKISEISPTVIGITGSYGKSSTKEFVAQILSQKFDVLKTTGNENTEFGIARKVKDFLEKGTEFFVAEMGAYKIGEIKKLAAIIEPSVGIITGIEEQHLSLFGNLENIKKAKFELIEALPKNGVAIFNLSNEYCRELAEKARGLPTHLRVLGYYVVREKGDIKFKNVDIVSKLMSADSNSIKIQIRYKNDEKTIKTSLTGLHFIENLTAAILIARLYKVPWEDIKKACENIKLPERTMSVTKIESGAVLIDDTHNATPRAFESALDYLTLFKGRRKVVVTSGIIELGKASQEIHEKLGKKMSNLVDKVFLTNPDYLPGLKKGLGDNSDKLIFSKDREELVLKIKKELDHKNGVILLEGRIPQVILEDTKVKI